MKDQNEQTEQEVGGRGAGPVLIVAVSCQVEVEQVCRALGAASVTVELAEEEAEQLAEHLAPFAVPSVEELAPAPAPARGIPNPVNQERARRRMNR